MKVRIVLTGRSYHLANEVPAELELPEGARLDDAISEVNKRLPDESPLPPSCLIAVAAQHVGTVGAHEDQPLKDGEEVTFVAPVAGG